MSQSLSKIWVHLIWSTKERWPFLSDREFRFSVHRYLAKTAAELKCPTVMVGGVADHVHILCALHKTIALAQLIEKLKKSSSKWVKSHQNQDADLGHFFWQRGYGAFSVSQSNLQSVKNYIENQEHHHELVTFQDEFRSFLDRHQIPYDEQYVWD